MNSIDFEKWSDIIRKGAAGFNLQLTDHQIRLFYKHAEALRQWSKKTNLTSITDPIEIAIKHFIDSIGPVTFFNPMSRVLDMGSGGGFPGLPLKVNCPAIDLTLVDAVRKKTSFIQHVIRQLGLKNTRAIHARVEELSRTKPIHAFDTVVCRAFSNLTFIVTHALPLISETGQIVIWKGQIPAQEIRAVQPFLDSSKRRLELSLQSYRLPVLNAKRTLVVINAKP
jgi:16S rRNA (guanine527-N7)-methyltransferase